MADEIPIPETWEEFQKVAEKSIETMETLLKVPVPKSVKDAVAGNFLEAGNGFLEKALGTTGKGEMQTWKTRVIPLKRANAILRELESELVKSYVLSAATPARIVFNGINAIQHFVIEHLAEITLIAWPLLVTIGSSVADVVSIEREITRLEKLRDRHEDSLSSLYATTPRGNALPPPGLLQPNISMWYLENPTASELRDAIKDVEDDLKSTKRTIEDLKKLSANSHGTFERALIAIAVLLTFLSVAKLIAVGRSVKDALVTLAPVKELRSSIVEKVKASALPQFPQHRKVVRKRSRRN